MEHRSFARMGIATFYIQNISQSLLRQISRHPHLNLQVKSSRYCDMSDVNCYIPQNVNSIFQEDLYMDINDDYQTIMNIYKKWKLKEEETEQKELDIAKLFLPLGSTTDLIVSGNYQALYEFCELRNCVRAEGEIRELSHTMTKILSEILPEIFDELDCRAKTTGFCNEFKPCGKFPAK